MNKTKTILSILLLSIFFIGCNSKPDRDKCIKLLVAVQEPVHRAIPLYQEYLSVLKTIIDDEMNNNWQPADPKYVDSIKKYDRLLSGKIDDDVKTVGSLKELDADFTIKVKTHDYLQHVSLFIKGTTPVIIRLCTEGKKGINENEFNELKDKAGDLQLEGQDLIAILTHFQDKYTITDEELKKQGLSDLPVQN